MKVTVIILTKNRDQLLERALYSVARQSLRNFEIVVVNDGSTDNTRSMLENFKGQISSQSSDGMTRRMTGLNFKILHHDHSQGITVSRQEALAECGGEYVALLDDDDEWIDSEKLQKQISWFEKNPQGVLCGGNIQIKNPKSKKQITKKRPEGDDQIRKRMLLQNPFFTSTVMFKKSAAMEVGGFVKDNIDLAEDYDLWLRIAKKGTLYNFQEVFTNYSLPRYNKEKRRLFLQKQLRLVFLHRHEYPFFSLTRIILKMRIFFL